MTTIKKLRNSNMPIWVFYFLFVLIALITHEGEPMFSVAGPYGWGKAVAWFILGFFLLYSLYCSRKEKFLRTMSLVWPYYWFRQVSYDLYIGVFVMLCLIYFNEGSIWVAALWFVPCLLMANLASLLYIALNYQSLIAKFI